MKDLNKLLDPIGKLLDSAAQFAGNRIRPRATLKNSQKKLRNLTTAEKVCLRAFMQNRRAKFYYRGPAQRLRAIGAITLISPYRRGEILEFMITDWAWDYLKTHPELLETADEWAF